MGEASSVLGTITAYLDEGALVMHNELDGGARDCLRQHAERKCNFRVDRLRISLKRSAPSPPRGARGGEGSARPYCAASVRETLTYLSSAAILAMPAFAQASLRMPRNLRDRKSTRLNSSHSQIS